MIALADSQYFSQGITLLKNGIPYYCIFGEQKIWSRNMRNAAIMVLNDLGASPEELEQ